MLCENCGKDNANVHYTEIINGDKKQIYLCEECSKKLGIGKMNLNIPINFSSFLGDFLEDFQNSAFMPTLDIKNELKCNSCNMTFDNFLNTGKLGCSNCYKTFERKIDQILKNIHGNNRHIGRIGNIIENNKLKFEDNIKNYEQEKQLTQTEDLKEKQTQLSKIEDLKEKLKIAIKEERYEDAAKLRDEIKKIDN